MVDAIEIDFLAVGKKSKSGDAIAVRYGTDTAWSVMVVDGGDLEAGDNLVAHLKDKYGVTDYINDVVCTHCDTDHVSGLRRVLEHFTVGNLWIHQPWKHAAALLPYFKHNWSEAGLAAHLRNDCFPTVASLCDLAEEQGVNMMEPFAGLTVGPFHILAPTRQRYLDLVPTMAQTPVHKSLVETVFASMARTVETALTTFETWSFETLGTPAANATSAANETSTVLFSKHADVKILLTGDAGVGALNEAIWAAEELGLDIQSPNLVQLPHHGSRRNVSPAVLDAILGAKLSEEGHTRGWGISSTGEGADGHPRKVVLNAFRRRGYNCKATKGSLINYRSGFAQRSGLTSVTPEPFHHLVED